MYRIAIRPVLLDVWEIVPGEFDDSMIEEQLKQLMFVHGIENVELYQKVSVQAELVINLQIGIKQILETAVQQVLQDAAQAVEALESTKDSKSDQSVEIDPANYITPNEAAAERGYVPGTVHTMANRGEIPFVKAPNGRIYIPRAAWEEWKAVHPVAGKK